jgi:hypothetical protein
MLVLMVPSTSLGLRAVGSSPSESDIDVTVDPPLSIRRWRAPSKVSDPPSASESAKRWPCVTRPFLSPINYGCRTTQR